MEKVRIVITKIIIMLKAILLIPHIQVIKTTIPAKYINADTKYHINPCGNFVIGGETFVLLLLLHIDNHILLLLLLLPPSSGPMGDAGLTGRKIIVDTYGGWGAHGGRCPAAPATPTISTPPAPPQAVPSLARTTPR